jgi:hypothetical protein
MGGKEAHRLGRAYQWTSETGKAAAQRKRAKKQP